MEYREVKNVQRLISKCEDILDEKVKVGGKKWRIGKYVQALDEKISLLEQKFSDRINADQLKTFKQRLNILKEVAADQKNEQTGPKSVETPLLIQDNDEELKAMPPKLASAAKERSLDSPNLHGSSLLRRKAVHDHQDMRDSLFNKSESHHEATKEESTESLLSRHEKTREKVAAEMIEMTKSLKHISKAAQNIIRGDKQVIEDAISQADRNVVDIHRETDRLKEKNRSCSWGTWIMLVVVFIVFIQMVLFIRFFPKR